MWFHLQEGSEAIKLTEAEGQMVVAGAEKREEMESCWSNSITLQLCKIEAF